MSLYNMLFGVNPQAALLLAVIGLRENDVERFRNVSASADGKTIEVYTRTGGGNREDYPQLLMRHLPSWIDSVDDGFDSTYCTDTFSVPDKFVKDVAKLDDVIGNGLRKAFGQHLMKTLKRPPTESDKEAALYASEERELSRTKHTKANGHTFVPYNDSAMGIALKLAENNNGKLRSCWGILPLTLNVKRNYAMFPNSRDYSKRLERVDIDCVWTIDDEYWNHCKDVFLDKYPVAMAEIGECVEDYLNPIKPKR